MKGAILRKVTKDDIMLLYNWANDNEVRKNAFNINYIYINVNKKWFEDKLNSERCDMFIYMYHSKPIGQVRVDYDEKDIGYIDYSVADGYRGYGHGKNIIHLVEREVAYKVVCLIALVKEDNIASKLVFEKNLYKKEAGIYIKTLSKKI